QPRIIRNVELLRHLVQLCNRFALQFGDVHESLRRNERYQIITGEPAILRAIWVDRDLSGSEQIWSDWATEARAPLLHWQVSCRGILKKHNIIISGRQGSLERAAPA